MFKARFMVFALAAGLVAASSAVAQMPARVRGEISSVDTGELQVTTRSGDTVSVKLPEAVVITIIVPIAIDAIKPGSFIGTAARTQPGGTLRALEVQVFPESMRGVGEGHRPWDLGPDSTMTNGTVGTLQRIEDERTLTLAYKGGEKTVIVPPDAPIITYEPGSRTALIPGAHVIVTATRNPDETLTAIRIGVGKDGLVPPM